jgi:hypothetical protein
MCVYGTYDDGLRTGTCVYGTYDDGLRSGREVDHLSPSSSEVKNEWSCTSTFPVCLHGRYRDFIIIIIAADYTAQEVCLLTLLHCL